MSRAGEAVRRRYRVVARALVPAMLAAALAPAVGAKTSEHGRHQQQLPPIDSQVVFLYYADLDAAAAFYGDTLGLEKTFDEGWVKIYATSETSFVGLVDEQRGSHRASEDKPVMLSLVTADVDAWHERLRERGVRILSEPADSTSVPVRAFLVEDPGGYTVEFFQWLEQR